MAKKLKWNLILMSVLYLGLGIFLLMRPSTALNVVCYALGGVVLVCAAVQLVRYFAVERGIFQSQLTLISGIICLGLGAFLILRSDIVVRILPIVFGLSSSSTAWAASRTLWTCAAVSTPAGRASCCCRCSAWCWAW